ncbi:MAG: DUF3788 domain-containing protein [Acidobacteriia bacterium]|nr:DUF3788 domain-containing protein [Terriglobia bacterium]
MRVEFVPWNRVHYQLPQVWWPTSLKRSKVEIQNAFIGKSEKPTAEEVSAALGPSAKLWKQLADWLAEEQGVAVQEWKSISPKYGWTLRLKLKKRIIVHLSPCGGCFRVLFILGDRAIRAARQSNLPQNVAKVIEDAPRYPEGTGVRLVVRGARDLAAIRKLALVKLEN